MGGVSTLLPTYARKKRFSQDSPAIWLELAKNRGNFQPWAVKSAEKPPRQNSRLANEGKNLQALPTNNHNHDAYRT